MSRDDNNYDEVNVQKLFGRNLQAAVERLAMIEDSYETCRIDRDYWKSRAEALERAVKNVAVFDVDMPMPGLPCLMCTSNTTGEGGCYGCNDEYSGWKFDDARFAKPEAEAQQ